MIYIGVIYQIKNILTGQMYIGMTSVDLKSRIRSHRSAHLNQNKREYNRKLYRAMREDGFDNFVFSVLEECPNELLPQK